MEVYYPKVFFHALGSDSAKDPLIFGEGRAPEDYPNVSLSDDDRWLVIGVAQGWAIADVALRRRRDRESASRCHPGLLHKV